MNEIKKLSELNETQVNQAINVFVEGFYNVFSRICKEKSKFHIIFKNSFDFDMTYAYLLDEDAIGFLGLADNNKRPVKINKEIYMEEIGGTAARISYKGLSSSLEKVNVFDPQEIGIDFIATDPAYRSKGIGAQLIEYVRDTLGYKHISLEVFSKNPRAQKMYEREGFKVVEVKNNLMLILQGLGKRVIMRWDAEEAVQ